MTEPTYRHPSDPYARTYDRYPPPPAGHYPPPPPAYPPTWSIPTQGGHPGPGLHPTSFGGYPPPPPPRRGLSGLAIAALAGGATVLAVLLVLGIVWATSAPVVAPTSAPATSPARPTTSVPTPTTPTTRPPTTPSTESTSVNVVDLSVGNCVNASTSGATGIQLSITSCTSAHDGEVFAVFTVPGSTFPGRTEVVRQAEDGCGDSQLAAYAPSAARDPDITVSYTYPTAESWAAGSREVSCIAVTDPPATGSIRGR